MSKVSVEIVRNVVKNLCISANLNLPSDIIQAIENSLKNEANPVAIDVLKNMLNNLDAAKECCVPICQDTGMAVIFIDIGQQVQLVDGDLTDAINEGVSSGYIDGLLRCSVVKDPINRVNTANNTPAIVHTRIVQGDEINITVAPKGFGSENMSQIKMFTPSATQKDITTYIIEVVKQAAGNPCPPIILGIGIGGDFELSAILAKRALCRPLNKPNSNEYYKKMETDVKNKVNQLGIGPQGFGGNTTTLGVNIETHATHIAGLPVAVNVGCHVTRHASATISNDKTTYHKI